MLASNIWNIITILKILQFKNLIGYFIIFSSHYLCHQSRNMFQKYVDLILKNIFFSYYSIENSWAS